MKTVYFKNRFRGHPYHSLYQETIKNPPEGFKIMMDEVSSLQGSNLIDINLKFQRSFVTKDLWQNGKPLIYLLWQAYNKKVEKFEIDLVFSMQQLIFAKVPWIVDLEFIDALVGYGNIRSCRPIVKKALNSRFCKKILPWSEWSKRTLIKSLDCKSFENKIETVNLAVKPKNCLKLNNDSKVRLLFVGSTNPSNIQNFELKGGIEVLESFVELNKINANLELVVRSWVPEDILKKYSKNKNIIFYPKPLIFEEFEKLFTTSDIFLFPSHANLGLAILEAMSYGLPVVALDIYDIPEAITDMKTGLLLNPSLKVPYYTWDGGPNHYDDNFILNIRHSRPWLVKQITEKVTTLIESDSLRKKLGDSGRNLIEHGDFSIEKRNKKLGRIFEEALNR